MRIQTIIPNILALIVCLNLAAQNKVQNDLNSLRNLKSNDTILIDTKIGGCFTGLWSKTIISKTDDYYEMAQIKNLTQTLIKHDKILLTAEKTESWVQKNFQSLVRDSDKLKMIKSDYLALIDNLMESMESNRNCVSISAGDYSKLRIETGNLILNYKYNCKIDFGL